MKFLAGGNSWQKKTKIFKTVYLLLNGELFKNSGQIAKFQIVREIFLEGVGRRYLIWQQRWIISCSGAIFERIGALWRNPSIYLLKVKKNPPWHLTSPPASMIQCWWHCLLQPGANIRGGYGGVIFRFNPLCLHACWNACCQQTCWQHAFLIISLFVILPPACFISIDFERFSMLEAASATYGAKTRNWPAVSMHYKIKFLLWNFTLLPACMLSCYLPLKPPLAREATKVCVCWQGEAIFF